MTTHSSRPWYFRPIGFLVGVVFFPLFILWYLWVESLRPTWQKIFLSALSVLMLFFYLGAAIGSSPDSFKEFTELEALSFKTETVDDSNLEVGSTRVEQEGRDGKKAVTYRVLMSGTIEGEREKVGEVIIEQSVAKRVAKGTKPKVVEVSPSQAPSPVAPAPTTQKPATTTKPQSPASNCDPNYSPCIPNVSYDLDCGDIGVSVTVVGVDRHRFDRDGDGYGCESY